MFCTTVKTDGGSVEKVTLVKASETPIRRHTKIKGAAKPFDPAWEEYFENRFGQTLGRTFIGRYSLKLQLRFELSAQPDFVGDHYIDSGISK